MTVDNIDSSEMQKSCEKQNSVDFQKSLGKKIQPAEITINETDSRTRNQKWLKIGIIAGLAYSNFWMAASISVQAPFFPQEAEKKGATPTQYGLVFGIYELVVLIMSPIYGKLIPRISPKFLIITGSLVGGTACAIFGILDVIPPGSPYIVMAFVVRIVEGIGGAALFTASFTIIAVEFPTSVATSFSMAETAFGLGLIVGPTIGGALYQVGGFMLPFIVNGSFMILGSGILAYLLPKTATDRPSDSRNIFNFLFDGGIVCYALSIISCLIFIGFNDATLEPHLRKFNLSPLILGFIFVVQGGIYAITTPIWGFVCDKGVNPLHINLLGYCLTCVGILFIAPVPFIPFQASLWTVILSLLIVGLGLAAKLVSSFAGTLQNTLEREFPDNLSTYGMVSAFFSTACSAGGFIGPSVGGLLLDTTGYRMGTVVIFSLEVFCMILLVAYVIIVQHRKSSKLEKEKEPLLGQITEKSEKQKPNYLSL